MINIMTKVFTKFSLALLIVSGSFMLNSNAQDISAGGFSGTVNTTLSSGVSIRASERDCSMVVGFTTDLTQALGQAPKISGTGAGCDVMRTDPYGNTSSKPLKIGSQNNDDGNMNYDLGDVFSATQKVYTEVIGDYNGIGVNFSAVGSVNPALSIYRPTYAPFSNESEEAFESDLDILNAYITSSSELPDGRYLDLTIGRHVTSWGEATFLPIGMNGMVTNAIDLSKARAPGSSIKEALVPTEQITANFDLGGGTGLELYYQLNSEQVLLDPASSFFGAEAVAAGGRGLADAVNFKERAGQTNCPLSLIGTSESNCNAANVAFMATDAGIEAHDGNYLVNTGLRDLAAEAGGAALLYAGAATAATTVWGGTGASFAVDSLTDNAAAQWSDTLTGTLATLDAATYGPTRTYYTAQSGDIDTSYKLKSTAGISNVNSIVTASSATAASMAVDYAALNHTSGQNIRDRNGAVVFERDRTDFQRFARNDGQWGVALRGYSDVGTGIDWSIHGANYHSKVPYMRFTGKGGIYSGDMYGLFTNIRAKDADADLTLDGTLGVDFSAAEAMIYKGLVNAYYSPGVCDAAFGSAVGAAYLNAIDPQGDLDDDGTAAAKLAARTTGEDSYNGYWTVLNISSMEKAWAERQQWDTLVGSNYEHNQATCYGTATNLGLATQAQNVGGTADAPTNFHDKLAMQGNMLSAAIAPLNYASYHLIYPEDNTALGFSFNTNVSGTTINAEVTYRPDFPLATSPVDQINQIGDVTGAFDMLDALAFDGLSKIGNSNTNIYGADMPDAGSTISTDFFDPAAPTATSCAAMVAIGHVTASANAYAACVANGTNLGLVLSDGADYQKYNYWYGSGNSLNSLQIALASYRKAIYEGAIKATLDAIDPTGYTWSATQRACTANISDDNVGGSADFVNCGTWNTVFNSLTTAQQTAINGAYDGALWAFNRSSLPAIGIANTYSDYYTTPFIEYDVWSADIGTTTSFTASHPVVQGLGADSAVLLTEVGVVMIDGMDDTANGYVSRGGSQAGIGNAKCLGGLGGTLDSTPYGFGSVTAITHLGAAMADGLFGNGKYCESQSGADDISVTYRLLGSATYNNFNNSRWALSPRVVWAHDPYGYGPSSLGGFVEGKMSMSLGLGLAMGSDISADLSYVNQLGDVFANTSRDKDYLSMSVSYAF